MKKLYNCLFLDIDGVLNHQFSKDREYSTTERFGIAQDLVDNLKKVICDVNDCKIVICSPWHSFSACDGVSLDRSLRDVLCAMLQVPYDAICEDIQSCNGLTIDDAESKAKSIKLFLEEHMHEIKNYVVIDDECSALRKSFPNNCVDCNSATHDGFTAAKANEAIWILTNFGKNKKLDKSTFVIGDCHFWHSNIIKYCNRPWWKKDENGIDVPDVQQMNDDMVRIWNSIVTSDQQTVYINGDFCFGSKTKVKEIFDRLNGRKRLVLGNHDRCKFKDYYDIGFDRVYDAPILLEDICILSHEPLQWVKDGDVCVNVYAHVHTQEMYKDFTANSFCTSAERLSYKPIRFTEIFKKCQSCNVQY